MSGSSKISCGGSLISSTHILTSTNRDKILDVSSKLLTVMIGAWNINVDYAMIYPKYDWLRAHSNYAIFKLEEKSNYPPVNLDLDRSRSVDLSENVTVTIIGAGALSSNNDSPPAKRAYGSWTEYVVKRQSDGVEPLGRYNGGPVIIKGETSASEFIECVDDKGGSDTCGEIAQHLKIFLSLLVLGLTYLQHFETNRYFSFLDVKS